MAIIDEGFWELEKRINNAKSKEEENILVKEVRKKYFSNKGDVVEKLPTKYKAEMQKYFIDKDKFYSDLWDAGTSYHEVSKLLGNPTHSFGRSSIGDYVVFSDGQREMLREFSGLDIVDYADKVEDAIQQPSHLIKVAKVDKLMKEQRIGRGAMSNKLQCEQSYMSNRLREGHMPLHLAMEMCDILGVEHEDIIVDRRENKDE